MNEEGTQVCKKCGRILILVDFPKCSTATNGHAGRCKACKSSENKNRLEALKKDPIWVEKEKRRDREQKRGRKNKSETTEQRRKYRNRWLKLFPEKYAAMNAFQLIPKVKGRCNHHWSYNKAHHKDVIVLTTMRHGLVHRFMTYDQERMMYRRMDGSLIDSREAAITYYATLKDE